MVTLQEKDVEYAKKTKSNLGFMTESSVFWENRLLGAIINQDIKTLVSLD